MLGREGREELASACFRSGKRPEATFLTQIGRSPVVRRVGRHNDDAVVGSEHPVHDLVALARVDRRLEVGKGSKR